MRLSSAVILIHGEEILLIKRKKEPFKEYWALAGGAKRVEESFADCALREVEEEVGVWLRGVAHADDIFVENELGQQVSQIFFAELKDSDIPKIRAGKEIIETKFFPKRELPSPIVPFHKEVIERFFSQQSVPC